MFNFVHVERKLLTVFVFELCVHLIWCVFEQVLCFIFKFNFKWFSFFCLLIIFLSFMGHGCKYTKLTQKINRNKKENQIFVLFFPDFISLLFLMTTTFKNPPGTRIQCSTLAGRPVFGTAGPGQERWWGRERVPHLLPSGRSPFLGSAASWSAGLHHMSDCRAPSLLWPSWECVGGTTIREGLQQSSENIQLNLCYQEANHMTELLIRMSNYKFRL